MKPLKNRLIVVIALYSWLVIIGTILSINWLVSHSSEPINAISPTINPDNNVPNQPLLTADFGIDLSKYSILKKDPAINESRPIKAVIVPHHLVPEALTVNSLYTVSANLEKQRIDIKRIILMSPNHFNAGSADILSSDLNWQLKEDVLEADKDYIQQLKAANFLQLDNQALSNEHGIFNLLPYIKFFFGQAKIVPLIIKEPLDRGQGDKLAQYFQKTFNNDTLVIVSADFSHYLPQNVAMFHDQKSQAALANFDLANLSKLDVDTPASLYIMQRYLQQIKSQRFVLLENSSSFDYIAARGSQDSTSYVSGYYTQGQLKINPLINLLFVGDLMLDRDVFAKALKSKNFELPFEKLALFLQGIDYKIANLEGPITDMPSKSLTDSGLQFTISRNYLPSLKKYFNIFSLANNHTDDYGTTGLTQTESSLKQSGLEFFGNPGNRANLATIIEKNQLKIGYIGYDDLLNPDRAKIIEEIKTVSAKSDYQIIYVHWGKEYSQTPSSSQIALAHKFIDAGADLIIGSHPHVIQPLEIYKEKLIFYSLGNFIFDQNFSQFTTQSLGVGITLNKKDAKIKREFFLFPLSINKEHQAEIAPLEIERQILDFMADKSINASVFKEKIRSGRFSL